MAIRLKTNPARGGYIEDVYVRDCVVKAGKIGINMTLRYSSSGAMNGDAIPVIRNIDIRNTTFKSLTKRPVFIQGWSNPPAFTMSPLWIAAFFTPRKKLRHQCDRHRDGRFKV